MSRFLIALPHASRSLTRVVVACLLQVLFASQAFGSPPAPRRSRAWRERAPQLAYQARDRTSALSPVLARALREPPVHPRSRRAVRERPSHARAQRSYSVFVYCATRSSIGRRVGLQLGVRRLPDHLAAEPRALLRDVTKVRFAAGIQLEL